MTLYGSPPKRTLDVLLERGRLIPTVPDDKRARALARARAASATSNVVGPSGAPVAHRRGWAITLAAAAAFVVGAAAAAAALRGRVQPTPLPPSPYANPVPCAVPTILSPTPNKAPDLDAAPEANRNEQSISAKEYYAAELGLLQRAQAAYQDGNFSTALLLVAEHRRRFPRGRLVEEREALHIKALTGAGRDNEARRAASAFSARFPRSALLGRPGQQPVDAK